jgi:late competence protein required for DNA uptake (superfamily II DNA/RNA helicase)
MGGGEMIVNNLKEVSIEGKKISSRILHWGEGGKIFLNITAPPYNTSLIFIEILMKFIDEGKNVLYITGEEEKNIEIIGYLRKYTKFRNYTYIRNNTSISNSCLNFCTYSRAITIPKKYDLVIYDDIRSYPNYSKYEILDIVNKCCDEKGKIIAYSIELIFNNAEEIVVPMRNNRMPITEPRIITTRIDVNKDVPFVVYEYIKWSISIGKRVIIAVPDDTKVFNVTSYIYKYFKSTTHNIFYYSKNEKNVKVIRECHKYKDVIVITNDLDVICDDDYKTNILVFFAEDNQYNYKKLAYFCGRTGKGDIVNRGEVIYLVKEENKEIDRAKDITRTFNKMAWEKGFFSL